LQAHAEVHRLTQERADVSVDLDSSRKLLDDAVEAAEAVRTTQATLDAALTGALAAERLARAARDSLPSISQIDSWADAYLRSNVSALHVAESTVKLAAATDALAVADQALANCKAAEASSADGVQRLRHQQGVLGYSDLLVAGEACPLCLQPVHELPQHHLDTELAAAITALDTAKAALEEATSVCDQQRSSVASLNSEIAATEKLIEGLSTSLVGAPAEVDLAGLRDEAELKSTEVEAAEAATIAAEAAAKAHRESPRTALALRVETNARRKVDELATTELDVTTRLAAARTAVETGPPEEQLQTARRRGEQLQLAVDEADAAFELAERAAEAAGELQNAATERAEEAWAHFRATRERVAGFVPPATDGNDLSVSWATLADWASREVDVAERERGDVENEVLRKTKERSDIVERTLLVGQAVLPNLDATLPLTAIGELLTEARANAASDLKQFDERRVAMAGLQERVKLLDDESDVAGKLGDLLRTDGFENWLMEAALGVLVDRATKRLFELSGGQYSLEIDKRDFAVRDHTNADELRSARTLSGGETFLASLSLALALADATADLAPEGAPQMESIFLDEGFGTLDPNTLDTVAAAIEELGAGGRLVGIITHIRELADRMPVRLEVTKTGGAATVERVEV
jgi:exonuclease SbcC